MNAIRLKTEYLFHPLGIDIDRPRLFWNCDGGVTQTAYQIVAANDSDAILWDSGRVESTSMRAQWGGTPVPPRTAVTWKVRLWDETGEAGDWSEARFETGLPKDEPWAAQWISGDYTPRKKERYPVDCFRKCFTVSGVKKARLYITACGLYEAELNGTRVDNFVLAPGHTDYRKRVQYQTYDVTGLLKEGENTLTVQLADGWYRGSCGAWGLLDQYGTQTKLLAQLELTGQDGIVTTVCSDGAWAWSNDGPIRFADNQDGEVVDARLSPSYKGKARVVKHPVIPSASNNVPVTEHETFKPTLITTPSGKTVLDFGQNIAGYVSFSLTAQAGQRLKLRFGELLDRDGEFTQKNIQCSNKRKTTPLQQVEYTCKDGCNDYKTAFSIFGFQYILVESDFAIDPACFTATAVYSDLERTGWFESSNELLNKLFACTLWSAKNNHADIPTDCPTRERHGWSGDAQIFCSTACYLFDYMAFGEKYLGDLYDWQKKSGRLPQVAPHGGVDFYMNVMDGCVGWADAGVLMPYVLWKRYGDESILRKYYAGMRQYAKFMISRCGKWGGPYAKPTGVRGADKKYLVNRGQSYDEWAEPADVYTFNWMHFAAPHPEVSTAYTSYIMGIMAEIAQALGETADIPLYQEYHKGCKRAYRALLQRPGFSLDTDRQARLVRPLYMDLLDEAQTEYAKKRLIQALEHYGWRLGTGFLSTPLILYVLAEMDIEYAYRLLENEEIPGWLSMPKQGATTIWEGWEGPNAQEGIASLDHYSKGAVLQWVFDTICGIQVAGENRFTIAPRPGGHFTHAKGSYTSVYGRVESGWRKADGGAEFTITVPANCTAQVILPDGSEREQSAGTQTYLISEG